MNQSKKALTFLCTMTISLAMLGCGTPASNKGIDNSTQNLSVLYAGSMTRVMEQKIGPGFEKHTQFHFQGEGKGSTALANMMKSNVANPDVFISASPSVNTRMLMGNENSNLVNWFVTIASDQLVIAYSPKSQFKDKLDSAKAGTSRWYQVLQTPGLRIGRTDPALDPKGVNTIFMFELAERYYHIPGLASNILGTDTNPNQVFPEESLLAQLTSGQLDAMIAYKHEAVEWNIPYISLPDTINLGNVQDGKIYSQAVYKPKKGKTQKGAPIIFTAAIPSNASNQYGATAFMKYMIAGAGHDMLMTDGFSRINIQVAGDLSKVPTSLKPYITGTFPIH